MGLFSKPEPKAPMELTVGKNYRLKVSSNISTRSRLVVVIESAKLTAVKTSSGCSALLTFDYGNRWSTFWEEEILSAEEV